MLQLKHIRKAYKTSDFTQVALNDVSVTFRDSEFVAVLGPSGSGKTTMLNVLGGLDHADSGDIVVNGVSTHDFKSKDWDTYRNHRVGFVFQSYNLIPHQSVLSNVELALTLSGVGRQERRVRATKALQQVGLGDHLHKHPNQLSGGQMQRVAIARALVNDPDIVLADEPTGALDTQTGIQVMNILKDVAKDRLVVMVTHNPELAQQYATRIVRVQDGHIVDDSNPLTSEEMARAENPGDDRQRAKSRRKASMSFLTALALSFNNLWSKKGRTLLTAFAGSIGIIGIAAILAVSNGVNNYIAKVEQDTLSNYPLQITQSSTDASSLMTGMMSAQGNTEGIGSSSDEQSNPSGDDQIPETNAVSTMFSEIKSNDLKSFKQFLDSGGNGITSHVSTIGYKYGITPMIYSSDTSS
ncbi:MAG: ABC transporter ATP-binding protein, partial [Atopobiaceae bacterium]